MIHGVPETPVLWDALIQQLDLPADQLIAPALPGFTSPAPRGFSATKEAYVDWLIARLEAEFSRSGPVDLVGHDWGAILSLRVAHLRPDLIKSWAALNAVVLPGARWHRVARLWQKPVVGEISMMLAWPWLTSRLLRARGMPDRLTKALCPEINRHMKGSILRLYRSGLDVDVAWGTDLSKLPKRGLVMWGDQDRFMSVEKATRFCQKWDVPLHIDRGLGHWAHEESPHLVATRLRQHWDQT